MPPKKNLFLLYIGNCWETSLNFVKVLEIVSIACYNKYNSDFIEKIKYRDVTVEEAQQYDKDIATIMNKIVLSFPEETASKIMILGAQSLEIWNTDKLEQMLKDGKISDTKNLEIYIELIKMKIELYNYFNQTKEENITI